MKSYLQQERISVFIVDDHYMVVEGIRSLLQNERAVEWAGHAMNAASCLSYLEKHSPDIILMDINLPDMSGIELCREVTAKHPAVRIIGLSTFNQQSFIDKMMHNGAAGYVLKNVSQPELMNAILTVMKGKDYLSEDAARTVRSADQAPVLLTRREKEVLELIGDGLTNNEIAQKIFVSVNTVDTHRKNLLNKFGCKNIASLIRKAVTAGLLQ